jgi:ribosome-interacting GTPase 1
MSINTYPTASTISTNATVISTPSIDRDDTEVNLAEILAELRIMNAHFTFINDITIDSIDIED